MSGSATAICRRNFEATNASVLLLIALLFCSVPAPVAAIRGALFRSGRSPTALAWRPVPPTMVNEVADGAAVVPPFLITSKQLINNKALTPVMVDLRQVAQWQREQAMVAGAVKKMLEENSREKEEAALREIQQVQQRARSVSPKSPAPAHIRFSIPALFGIPTRHLVANKRRAVVDWQMPLLPATAETDQLQQLIKPGGKSQPNQKKRAGEEQQYQPETKQQLGNVINMAKKFVISYSNREDGERRRR